jgi:selenocysteine lyase/cysteine desulfurase
VRNPAASITLVATTTPLMISSQRALFNIPDGITYLNCAYMSPLMHSVMDAGKTGLARKTRPWEVTADDFFNQDEDLRAIASKLFHSSADDIAIVPSASYGLSTAALNLPLNRGQRILVVAEQFPSNVYPWRRVAEDRGAEIVTVPWPEDGNWTAAVLEELKDGVAIAALPHTQWTSGGLLDLVKISEVCRKVGAALVLDLTQSLGVYPFDVRKVQPDFAVAAAYKWLLSPYSTGVMYVAPKWQETGRPLEENWIQRENARKFSDLILYTNNYQPGARRFDVGERSNFALIPAAIQAMQQIIAWGVDEISATIGDLNSKIIEGTQELGMTAPPEHLRAPHYLCLRCSTALPKNLVSDLVREGVYVSIRGTSIRVTPHLYNSEHDANHFIAALKNVMNAG